MAIKIDTEKCTGCGSCAEVCAVEAIVVEEKAHIDEEICIECQACVIECPEGAILVEGGSVHETPVSLDPEQQSDRGRSAGAGQGFDPLRDIASEIVRGEGTRGGIRGTVDRIFGRMGARGSGRGFRKNRGFCGRGRGRRGW